MERFIIEDMESIKDFFVVVRLVIL